MKNKIKDYLIILFFAIIISIPMLNKNFNIYVDDGVQHIARLMGTAQSIEEGQIIPVIMSNFCNGFGYSWNIFYSPITAYIPLIFSIFTNSFELMLKLFIILVSFLSGISIYEFVKKISNNRYAGLLSSAIYIFAPYRLTDMYIRIAISELTSFIFIPIVFQGMYNILNSEEKNFKKSLILTLGATGLILTHIVIAMYTAIFCTIYLILNIKKLKDRKILKLLIINILLIVVLTSFYTFPLLEHKFNTNYEVFENGRMERTEVLIYYKVNFLELIYSGKNTMNFEIGLISIIGLVLTILAYKKVENDTKKIYWFSLITGVLCVIMSLNFFPFEKLPAILKMIQFTFRLLEFSSFFFAVIAGINYCLVIKNFNIKDVIVLGTISFLLIVPNYTKLDFEKQWSEEKLWPSVAVTEKTGRVHAGCASFEYLPSKAFDNLEYIKNRKNNVYIISGNAIISNEQKQGTNMTFNVSNVEENTVIELPYIYYLGYNIKITNNYGEIIKANVFESNNGFVAFNLPMDSSNVVVKYTGTLIMKITYIVSFITFIGLIINLLFLSKYSKIE